MKKPVLLDDREKAMDKIKKCLRLAESSNPNEAATALRQAQKLMQSLGVTETDIHASEIHAELVKTKEAFGGCPYLAKLVNVISLAFGVVAIWEPGAGISRTRASIRYHGPRARVLLAVYAHRVVDRAIRTGWYQMLDEEPGKRQERGARHAYRTGFLAGVEAKIVKLAPTDEEFKQINAYLAAKYGTSLTSKKVRKNGGDFDFDAYVRGANAAVNFDLNRPLTEGQMAIEHG